MRRKLTPICGNILISEFSEFTKRPQFFLERNEILDEEKFYECKFKKLVYLLKIVKDIRDENRYEIYQIRNFLIRNLSKLFKTMKYNFCEFDKFGNLSLQLKFQFLMVLYEYAKRDTAIREFLLEEKKFNIRAMKEPDQNCQTSLHRLQFRAAQFCAYIVLCRISF